MINDLLITLALFDRSLPAPSGGGALRDANPQPAQMPPPAVHAAARWHRIRRASRARLAR